jgi:uncharacterized protein (TIGR03032 family)
MTDPNAPLRSVHTSNFPDILNQLGISLVISTYQAGKVIVMRADGNTINTHFRIFPKPMGLAADHERMAIGSTLQIFELRNVPAVATKLDPPDRHDACYLPRKTHITGDIDIHEMAYAGSELWFVNTRFSCLCTLEDPTCTFVPRWRPPFVSAYDLSDRCHLNGLAVVDGQPRTVTALGATDTPAGWRKNKAFGGILMDVPSSEFITQGLSMPHSPRWYDGKLWVLESGKGSLAQVDPTTGAVETVTVMPGFTRGLAFWNRVAFVGLSQVRETAVFSGLPITEQAERNCGVWAVHLDTGQILAFLRFEAAVQEIFSVQVLPGIRFPELIDWDERLLGSSYVLPDAAVREVAQGPMEFDHDEQAEFLFRSGNDRYTQGNLTEAMHNYQQCLDLKPDFPLARYNLGVIYRQMERWEEAEAEFKQVVATDPNNAAVYNNLGIVAQHQGRFQDAVRDYQQAIALQADFATAHFNYGMLLLSLGDLKQGFAESEWRWQTEEFTPFDCPHPRWNGEDITGKTLLIHTEQGAGDAIQFCRFIPLAAERCAQILLVCMPELMPLFRTVPGIATLLPPGQLSLNDFQVFVPLMSLPYCLGTTLDTLPNAVPYLDVERSPTMQLLGEGLKVGIVWGGSPTHKHDHHRSTRLAAWLPILTLPGVTFFSLQKGERSAELGQLPDGVTVQDLGPQIRDFGDTANFLKQLDLVITVDTSVAHLAGALGLKVWVLLCADPDWRWLRDREADGLPSRLDSPWYPTMNLFRQAELDQWEPVMIEVRAMLQAQIA